MRKAFGLAAPLTIASLLLAACGSSSSSNPYSTAAAAPSAQTTASTAVVVKSASSASLGTVLVNAQGMTLYHLTGEGNGKFICTSSACLSVWHPVAVPAGGTAGGTGSLTVVKRPDGTSQVAYSGEPLYTFTSDTSPGEAKGQGLKDVGTWTTVTLAPAAQPSTTTSTSSGYGHSYP